MFDSGQSTTHAWYHTTDWHYRRGVRSVHGTKTRVFDSGQSTTHAWYQTTDWHYRRGVPVHGTKHECSIQVSRRPMHGITPDWRYRRGVLVHGTKHECSIQVSRRSMHGITPLTGVTVAGSPYTEQNTSVRFRSVDDPCMVSHH